MPNLTITLPRNQIQLLEGNQICLEVKKENELFFIDQGKEYYQEVTKYTPEKTFNYTSRHINDNISWGNKDCPKSKLTLSERISLYLNSFFQKTVKIRWHYPGIHDYKDQSLTITVDDETFKKMQQIRSRAIPTVDGNLVKGGKIIPPSLQS